MMKKILAAAIVSAFAAPAFAATANVDVYGQMHASFDMVDADGAANERRNRISSNNTHIGFKGAEDLGGGMSAIWQVETAFQLDQQNALGSQGSTDAQGGISRRNTFVGLSSKTLGSLTLGAQESPHKTSTGSLDVFLNTMGDMRSVFTKLTTRSDNAIMYTSPSMGGLVMRAMYGARNEAGNGSNPDPRMYALSGIYTKGPLFATLAYENNKNTQNATAATSTANNRYTCNGGANAGLIITASNAQTALAACNNTAPGATTTSAVLIGTATSGTVINTINATTALSSNVNSWRAGVGYTFGNTKLGLAYEKNSAEAAVSTAAGGTTAAPIAAINAGDKTNTGNAWYASVAHKMGNITLNGAYTKRSDYLSTSNDGATQMTVGADYSMSKRTNVYALYTRVDNEGNSVTGGNNGIGPGTGIATVSTIRGGDASGFSVGLLHRF